jgi:hypothetical protein
MRKHARDLIWGSPENMFAMTRLGCGKVYPASMRKFTDKGIGNCAMVSWCKDALGDGDVMK